jgi:hypothetical protein
MAWASNALQNEYVIIPACVNLVSVDPDDSTQPNYFQKQIDNGVYENSANMGWTNAIYFRFRKQ